MPLFLVLAQSSTFQHLLPYLGWSDVHALLDSSKQFRNLFSDRLSLHLILARFIPGFRACLSNQNRHVPVSILHLHLFIISQTYPLHLYPALALHSFSSLLPDNTELERLTSLALAHSRFVLLLQSFVHSSPNISIPTESFQPHLIEKLSPSLPELSFPVPLSYIHSSPPPYLPSQTPSKIPPSPTPRLNLFKPRALQPPPPASEPRILKAYGSSWRRSLVHRYSHSYSDSENDFIPPRRRHPTSSPPSRSSLSRNSSPSPPSSSPPLSSHPSSIGISPHDFIHAMSPVRAPVLRVFVPSTACSAAHAPTIVKCEEQLVRAGLWTQLSVGDVVCNLGHVPLTDIDPDTKPDPLDDSRREADINSGHSGHISLHHHSPPSHAQTWLIFNGSFLVPYTPYLTVPVQDALTLPSPFYYTHILPRLTNPVFALKHMPKFRYFPRHRNRRSQAHSPHGAYSRSDQSWNPNLSAKDIQTRLVYLPTKVPTSAGRYALVRRYMWIAHIFVDSPDQASAELGPGWRGEWILEGEGTKEGREMLLAWAQGEQKEGEWELVRERCKPGTIWLK